MILFLPVLAVIGAAGVAALGVWVMRRLVKGHVAEGHNDVLVPIFLTAGTIYAVFLAFVVVAVIMIFVIPAFKQVFTSFGADLPEAGRRA